MPRLLIATTNPGKLVEFRELLGGLPVELVLPERDLQVAETGRNYAENAALKARAYAALSGLPTLADDSGLEVDALGGAMALATSAFAERGASAFILSSDQGFLRKAASDTLSQMQAARSRVEAASAR